MHTIEEQVYLKLKEKQLHLTTAESATGGMIAAQLVNVPGISEFFQEGYVTYSNQAKTKMLGIDSEQIHHYGVVSEEIAREMAICVANRAATEAALSVTGVAGPDGGTPECPVGTIYIGCYLNGKVTVEHHVFSGTRMQIRTQACHRALELLLECIDSRKDKL